MYEKQHKTMEELLQIFIDRGMKVNKTDQALQRLSHINYYKMKEFAKPYYKRQTDGTYKYEKIAFEQVLNRFYQDKNLRVYLLHAIEKIEISFKTKIAYVLGRKHGAFGYLDFKNWCNKDKFIKQHIVEKELTFKRRILDLLEIPKKLKKEDKIINCKNTIIQDFFEENPDCIFPPVWMVIEILTFGDVLNLYKWMSEKNKEEIAKYYECGADEFETWLRTLKFIRNLCAHNSNVIDCIIETKPRIREEWKKYLFAYKDKKGKEIVTNKIGLVIIILEHLIGKVNPDYGFGNLRTIFDKLFQHSDLAAQKYGFANKSLKIFNKDFKI
ncbi:Abi-like protein [Fusobacterium necrophorum subsp. funduliforme ATCC 51357]|uniref:Abi family protein n=1 Tax=Fusobacterium necrophorum TaxID=859 RepID=UPI00025E6B2E|nr:Abi family protein [Fusobacterium necrophorum]EIJ69282.1 Abi-like protein [Fusobacterium necrophorum subsp. funduliforme ATCC 51357]KAB0553198.1 hypothetical protein F7P76_05060 [Fusobacterium necrophorum subsp. funduliforme]KYM65479.1 hypothetical protein A2U16_02995 [Fusobacterium necrophorum subsp. funduliforme]MBR8722419.1 hypothetical protein [Fusobacterium necrophorum subsp. funduliforme]